MITKNTKITGKQLMFSVACFIHGSTLLSSFVVGVTKQDTWVTVVAGFIFSLLIASMYISIAKKFPGKNIISINEEVFGKAAGKAVSCLYLFFFFALIILNTRDVGDFVVGYIMPETPMVAIAILFLLPCAYVAKKGIMSLVRIAFICMVLMFTVNLSSTVLLIPQMDFSNFLPSFTLPFIDYVHSTHTITILPFCEIMVFMMLLPYVQKDVNVGKSILGGMSIGFVLMLIVYIRDWAVLGPLGQQLVFLTFQTVRMLKIDDIITRTELFYAIVLSVLQFFKVSVLFFALSVGLAQVFKLDSYKKLILFVGIICVYFAVNVWESAAESAYWGMNVAAVFSTFFEVVLPGILLISIILKNKLKKGEPN